MAGVEAKRTLAKIILADQAPNRGVAGNQALDEIGSRSAGIDAEPMFGRHPACRDQRRRALGLIVEERVNDA